MLLGDAPRPCPRQHVLERLGFADGSEGIAEDRLDEVEHAECHVAVGVDPVSEVSAELGVEDGEAFALRCSGR